MKINKRKNKMEDEDVLGRYMVGEETKRRKKKRNGG